MTTPLLAFCARTKRRTFQPPKIIFVATDDRARVGRNALKEKIKRKKRGRKRSLSNGIFGLRVYA